MLSHNHFGNLGTLTDDVETAGFGLGNATSVDGVVFLGSIGAIGFDDFNRAGLAIGVTLL